jgi:hypothetical protein
MEMNGQLHATATLSPEKWSPVRQSWSGRCGVKKYLDHAEIRTPTVEPITNLSLDMCRWKDNIKVLPKKEGVVRFIWHTAVIYGAI